MINNNQAVYAVEHTTEFSYSQPVRENTFVLTMCPLQDEYQKIHYYRLKISPSSRVSQYKDHHGNRKHFFSVLKAHESLSIYSSFQVGVWPAQALSADVDEKEWKTLNNLKQSGDLRLWLDFGYFTKNSKTLENFLSRECIDKQKDPLTSLRLLNKKLFSIFSYTPKSTRADSGIKEILTSKKGVCQDYTHVMITIARLWGIPSRYVSGYLYQDPEGSSQVSGSESHAWCECYLPSLGWLGFDPTNNSLAGPRHIRVALGQDYKEIPPHNAFCKGGTTKELKVHVSVKRLETSREHLDKSC